MTSDPPHRPLRAPWVAMALACVAITLTARLRSLPCLSLVSVPTADLDAAPKTLPLIAHAGPRHDRPMGGFDHDLGEFRLECTSSNDGHYWDYDHCTFEVPRCASAPLDVRGIYGLFVYDLELRRGANGVYVAIEASSARPAFSFRTERGGRRAGLLAFLLPFAALLLAGGTLAMNRAARAHLARLAAWEGGVAREGNVVTPDDGGAALALASREFRPGTRVLFLPPRSVDYRSAPAPVQACAEEDILRQRAKSERRTQVILVASLGASFVALASLWMRW